MKTLKLLLPVVGLFLFTACNDDEATPPNEEEVITTLIMTFTPDGGGAAVAFTFQDLDGDGGNAPTTITAPLAANTTYNTTVTFLNETETPAEDITEEVKEEDEEHQVFYGITGANLTVAYADADADTNPVGVETVVTTGDASTGTLNVVLRHEPDKNAAGVSDGDITNAGGSSDIDVTFDVDIQ